MIRVKNAIVAIGLLLFSSLCFGGNYTGSSSIISISSIIEGDPVYGTYFVMRGGWIQKDGVCPSTQTDTWIITENNNSMAVVKSMYSMALSAYMAGKDIELYQDGCINGRPKARTIYLPNK